MQTLPARERTSVLSYLVQIGSGWDRMIRDVKLRRLLVAQSVVIVALLALLILVTFQWTRCSSRVERLPSQVQGIVVHYTYDPEAFFPPEWLSEPARCQGRQVDLSDAARVVPLIDEFASTYGIDFLRSNLTDIYLFGELQCYGKSLGGTNAQSSLYIKIPPQSQGFTDSFLLSTLHAEFSSILLRNYRFPYSEWEEANPAGFAYAENPFQVVEDPDQLAPTEELLLAGFLSPIAATSLENDLNRIAFSVFTGGKAFCEQAERYPRIALKVELATRFYRSVDPEIRLVSCE
jgi:hypothetical protein